MSLGSNDRCLPYYGLFASGFDPGGKDIGPSPAKTVVGIIKNASTTKTGKNIFHSSSIPLIK